MNHLNRRNTTVTLSIMTLLAMLAFGSISQAAQSEAAKKSNLYGVPSVISFPDLPAVPDKIKAPTPSSEAGAALKNIPSLDRSLTSSMPISDGPISDGPTSDAPAAAKSR